MTRLHNEGKLEAKFERAYFTTPRPIYELYDLEKDVGETKNLAAEQPDVYRDLKDRYVRWFTQATQ